MAKYWHPTRLDGRVFDEEFNCPLVPDDLHIGSHDHSVGQLVAV